MNDQDFSKFCHFLDYIAAKLILIRFNLGCSANTIDRKGKYIQATLIASEI